MRRGCLSCIITLALIACTACEKQEIGQLQELPSYEDYVAGIGLWLSEDGIAKSKLVCGGIDSVHVVAQINSGYGSLKEHQLRERFLQRIEEMIPDLRIVDDIKTADATVLVHLQLIAEGDLFYGIVDISLKRLVTITATGFELSKTVWSDPLPFLTRDDPREAIYWHIDLSATKFAALWTLSNR